MAIALSLLVFWNFVLLPPQVTAMELIERARVAEETPLRVLSKASVQRMLQASRRVDGVVEQQVEYEEIWDGVPGALHRVDARNTIVDEVGDAIPVSACAGLSPLSAMMMRCLATQDGTRSRVVNPLGQHDSGFQQIAIDYTAPEMGAPFTSIWRLRMSDWQITQVDFHFFSFPEEVSYRLVLLAQFVTDGERAAATTSRARATTAREVPARATGDRMAKPHLAGTKLAVFQALGGLRLTPDDEVRIETDIDNEAMSLRVVALVPDDLRKWQVEHALHPLAAVETAVYTYDEAAASPLAGSTETSTVRPQHPAASQPATSLRGEGPLLQEMLAAHFGGGEAGQEKVGTLSKFVLDATQDISFKTRWLGRIHTAFPADERQALSDAERASLRQLEAEALREIAAAHRALGDRLREDLCPAMCPSHAAEPSDPARIRQGNLVTSGKPEASGEQSVIQTMLGAALDAEFVLLKTLFVDRSFSKLSRMQQDGDVLKEDEALQSIASWLRRAEEVSGHLETALLNNRSGQMQANR